MGRHCILTNYSVQQQLKSHDYFLSRLYLDPLNQTVSHSVQPDRPGPSGQSSFGPTSLEPFSFQTSDFLTQNRTIEGRALNARIWIVQFSVIKFLEWLPKWPLLKMTDISHFLSNGLFRKKHDQIDRYLKQKWLFNYQNYQL